MANKELKGGGEVFSDDHLSFHRSFERQADVRSEIRSG